MDLLTALNASAEAVGLAWTPLVGSALHKGELHKLRDCWSVPLRFTHGAKPNATKEEVPLCLRGSKRCGKAGNRKVASSGYPECDYISMRVNTQGAWDECDLLVKLIQAEAKYNDHTPAPGAPGPLVLDVGANQGMCTHSLLLRTNARVVAFEPNPSNQFFLTQSLLLLARRQPDIAHRVVVLPLGLADVEADGVVTDGTTANRTARAVSNFGDARITLASSTTAQPAPSSSGPAAAAAAASAAAAPGPGRRTVRVRSLASLFPRGLGAAGVSLMKVDVQGFECNVLRGAWRVLGRVGVLVAEVQPELLAHQRCDVATLRSLLMPPGARDLGRLYPRARIVVPDDTSRHATRTGRAAEGQRWVQFLRAGHFKDPTYVSFDPFDAAAQLTGSRHSILWKEWMHGRGRSGATPSENGVNMRGRFGMDPGLGLV